MADVGGLAAPGHARHPPELARHLNGTRHPHAAASIRRDKSLKALREKPNVLHVIFDDLRPDLGAWGARWARTPHLDRLVRSGVSFTQAHAAVANCAPSRAAFLGGRRPDWSGVHDLRTQPRSRMPDLVTLPERLRQVGYVTAAYGKVFHSGHEDPQSWSPQADFADNITCRLARFGCFSSHGQAHRGHWRYYQYRRPVGPAPFDHLHERGPATSHGYTDHYIATHAIKALHILRSQPRPWYLSVGFVRPHLPFNSPSTFYDRFPPAAVPQPPRTLRPEAVSQLTARSIGEGYTELHAVRMRESMMNNSNLDAKGRRLASAYAAAVSFADSEFGRVLDTVRSDPDLAARTLIVAHGDHGWKLGHLGNWGKHSVQTQDTRTPLIFAGARVPRSRHGAMVHTPVELIDVYPTILALARVKHADATLDGRCDRTPS